MTFEGPSQPKLLYDLDCMIPWKRESVVVNIVRVRKVCLMKDRSTGEHTTCMEL